MNPTVRALARFSLAAFVLVVVFGTIRAAPTPLHALLAASPEAERAMASFHAHCDALCFVGAAALAVALHFGGVGPRVPAWAPRALATGYMAGSLLFSSGYVVKAFGLAFGLPVVAKGIAIAMISGGGLFLIGAAAAALLVLRGTGAGEGQAEG
jgi:hypothetical protein